MLAVSFILYLANMLFGLSIQLKIIDNKKIKWLHHVLYALVFILLAITIIYLVANGLNSWPLTLTLLTLIALPKYKGGTFNHIALSLLGFLGYFFTILLNR